MKVNHVVRLIAMVGAALAISLLTSGAALAHCDTMDGPVVKAAKQALKTRNINHVLIWVQPKDEAEVREAFRQVLAVRTLSPAARALADRYFFETLIRIHRAGEGQPYTGLKPAGTDLGPLIPVADKAMARGSLELLLNLFPDNLRPEISSRFREVIAKRNFQPNDVEGGRQFVAAYTKFLEYLEHLYELKSNGEGAGL